MKKLDIDLLKVLASVVCKKNSFSVFLQHINGEYCSAFDMGDLIFFYKPETDLALITNVIMWFIYITYLKRTLAHINSAVYVY